MHNLALTLLILPMIGALVAFIVGKVDKKFAFWSAELIGLSLFLITLKLYASYSEPIDIAMTWFRVGSFSVPFGITLMNSL